MKTKKPFKVGDKVKFYTIDPWSPFVGRVTKITTIGNLFVLAKYGISGDLRTFIIHPRQVTHRIVKKKKKQKKIVVECDWLHDENSKIIFPISVYDWEKLVGKSTRLTIEILE